MLILLNYAIVAWSNSIKSTCFFAGCFENYLNYITVLQNAFWAMTNWKNVPWLFSIWTIH